jgi:hypothetical protein
MDKYTLVTMLQELDQRLTSSYDIILVGGAAMILHFGASRATYDVDVLITKGDLTELRQAIHEIGQLHKLRDDWMNEGVKGFADILPRDFHRRLVRMDLSLDHLNLYFLGLPEQVAMKIVALREQDLEDLDLLLPKLSNEDKQSLLAIMEHVATFRIDWAQKMRYFLLEQGWKID